MWATPDKSLSCHPSRLFPLSLSYSSSHHVLAQASRPDSWRLGQMQFTFLGHLGLGWAFQSFWVWADTAGENLELPPGWTDLRLSLKAISRPRSSPATTDCLILGYPGHWGLVSSTAPPPPHVGPGSTRASGPLAHGHTHNVRSRTISTLTRRTTRHDDTRSKGPGIEESDQTLGIRGCHVLTCAAMYTPPRFKI